MFHGLPVENPHPKQRQHAEDTPQNVHLLVRQANQQRMRRKPQTEEAEDHDKQHAARAGPIIAQSGQRQHSAEKCRPIKIRLQVCKRSEPGQEPAKVDLLIGKRYIRQQTIAGRQDRKRSQAKPRQNETNSRPHHRTFSRTAFRLAAMRRSSGCCSTIASYWRSASRGSFSCSAMAARAS